MDTTHKLGSFLRQEIDLTHHFEFKVNGISTKVGMRTFV